ncbi:hypothetical protein L0F63_005988 [Massospora cicadina]|nr:hypothetical protein L0F63_005988 [Massospora cicadina]
MAPPVFGMLKDEPWLDILQMVTAVGSLVLNIVLLLANYRRGENRWATDGILCTINAIADSRVSDPKLIYDDSLWCKINYFVARSLALICLGIAALLALVRYLVIVRGHQPHPRRWTCVTLVFVGFSIFITVQRAAGARIYVYPSKLYCSPVSLQPSLSGVSVATAIEFLTILPLLIIPFCYSRVSTFYARLISNLNSSYIATRARFRVHHKILGILAIAIAYSLAVLPDYAVLVFLWHFKFSPPSLIIGLATCLSNFVSVLNAIFPLVYHEEIRREAVNFFMPTTPSLTFKPFT